MTDESCFTRTRVTTSHEGAEENPRAIIPKHSQRQFSINALMGVVGNNILGPAELHNHFDGNRYLEFLRVLLEDINPRTCGEMWLMHDGVPNTTSLARSEMPIARGPNRGLIRT